MGHEAERRGVELLAGLVLEGEQALEVRRDAEHGRGSQVPERPGHRRGLEGHDRDGPAGQQGPDREAQGRRVVERRDREVEVVGREAPQGAFLQRRRLGVLGGEPPRPHPLRTSGGAGGEVHGPVAGEWLEVALGTVGELVEHTGVVDHEGRLDLVEHHGALACGESRVQGDGHDPAPGGGEHEVDRARRAGRQQRDAVAVPQARGVQGACHPALAGGARRSAVDPRLIRHGSPGTLDSRDVPHIVSPERGVR